MEKYNNKYRIGSARAGWHGYDGGCYFVTICTAGREHYFGTINDGKMQLNELGKYVEEQIKISPQMRVDMNLDIPLYVVMPNHVHLIVFIGRDVLHTSLPEIATNIDERCRDVLHTSQTQTTAPQTQTTTNCNKYRPAVCCRDVCNTSLQPPETTTTRDEYRPAVCCRDVCNTSLPIPPRKNLSSIVRGIKSAVTRFTNEHHILFGWQTRFHDHIIRHSDELNRIADYITNNPSNWKTDELSQPYNKQ